MKALGATVLAITPLAALLKYKKTEHKFYSTRWKWWGGYGIINNKPLRLEVWTEDMLVPEYKE